EAMNGRRRILRGRAGRDDCGWPRRRQLRLRPAEEQAAEHGVGPGRTSEVERHVPGYIPDEVFAIVETGGRLGVQNGSASRIGGVDPLGPYSRIPVEEVKRDLVCIGVG